PCAPSPRAPPSCVPPPYAPPPYAPPPCAPPPPTWSPCAPRSRAAGRRRLRLDARQRQPIHVDPAVAHDPVQVRPGHAAGRADLADLLAGVDGVAPGDRRLAQVEIRGHEAGAVVDVDDVAAEEEFVDDAHDAPRGRVDRRAD